MIRKAFTMLELVIVIVVLGILAALAIPRLERDIKQEAADNILSAIRYTQHLALQDNKHLASDPKWQQRFWHIYFGTCDGEKFYAIGSDENMETSNNGRVDFLESALDPANGKRIWAHDGAGCAGSYDMKDLSPEIFLSKKYGVASYSATGGCTKSYLGFDHLGRPYSDAFPTSTTPDYSGYMTSECSLSFTLENGESFTIKVEPETGYAYIDGQNDS